MADKSTTTKPVKTKTEAPVATDAPAVKVTKKDADTSTATKPAVKTKKSKRKQSVPAGHVHIYATFNNTIITVTDKHGNTLAASSAGACGFRGSKKGTAYAAQVASEKATNTAKQNYGLAKVDVFVDGIGLGRDAAIRALQNTELTVESIKDVTTIPHGGTRPPKPRRG